MEVGVTEKESFGFSVGRVGEGAEGAIFHCQSPRL